MLNYFRVKCLQYISATAKSSATVEMQSGNAFYFYITKGYFY